MKPDTFTITSFWLDWLLVPVMILGAWLTIRWALADSRQASKLKAQGESEIPVWVFSIPLIIAAAGWIVAGSGTLIREDYWEMRMIFGAFILWTLGMIFGAGVLFFDFLRKDRGYGTLAIVNLIGQILMSLLMIFPSLINHASPAYVISVGHIWFLLLAVAVGLLMGGVMLGIPYNFPRFPLGLGVFFLVGWGLSEIAFRQASFPWLIRIWKLNVGIEYIDAFPTSAGWQILGAVKVLAGIGVVVMLFITLRHQRVMRNAV